MFKSGAGPLSLQDCEAVLFRDEKISLDPSAVTVVQDNYNFLKQFCANKVIYGINTGFGPMAQVKIPDDDLKQLQYNLIRSHCSGLGEILSPVHTRGMMLSRLNTLMLGYSGVHIHTAEILVEMLNRNINPCIYSHGGVGASGDLVQLAHLALAMIGEGQVICNGELKQAKDVFASEQIAPLDIYLREGIAVMNGTSAMTGVGLVNLILARNLVNWSVIFSAMLFEIVEAYDDYFSAELNNVKLHPGQMRIAESLRKITNGSHLLRNRQSVLYNEQQEEGFMKMKVQEYYSIRCVPHILGPVLDTLESAEKILINEVNSVNDNPVIDSKNKNVYHGGNFHGDYVALEMDKLRIVLTKTCMLADRQLNFLLNDKLNARLPAFINMGKPGLNFGLQGMQYTATSTVAECQTLSTSSYIHSIPSNNDNQDIVSMGTNAALLTSRVLENSFEVLSVLATAVIQAVAALKIEMKLSSHAEEIYNELSAVSPSFVTDAPHHMELAALKQYMIDNPKNFI